MDVSGWDRNFTVEMAFPLLGHYAEISPSALSFDVESPLADFVSDPHLRRDLERELSAVLLPSDGVISFGPAAPGLFRLLDVGLPYDRIAFRGATRDTNTLRSQGLRTWRHLAPLSPTDLMSLGDFGVVSLRRLAVVAIHDSIDALLNEDLEAVEEGTSPAELFRRIPADRFLEEQSVTQLLVSGAHAIGDLAPELRSRPPDDPLPDDFLPGRLRQRLPVSTWAELCEVRMSHLLRMRQIGLRTIAQLLASIREAIDDLGPPTGTGASAEAGLLLSTVGAIAAWAVAERDSERVSDVLDVVDHDSLPPRLGQEWQRLADTSLRALSSDRVPTGTLVSDLLEDLDSRARLLLSRRVWLSPSPVTLRELGETLGVSRERARQIESRAVAELRASLEDEHLAPISDRAFGIRLRLGSAVPLDSPELPAVMLWAIRDVDDRHQAEAWDFLRWLAGPYTESDGWLLASPDGPDPHGKELLDAADSWRFLSDEVVAEVLVSLGIRPQWRRAWVEHLGRFRRVEGGWLDTSGTIILQALRHLAFRGVPLTPQQILEELGRPDASERNLRWQLLGDPRAARLSKTEFGLREWGGEEFTTIPQKMVDEIARAGGSIALDALAERLAEAFGVSAASVRMYALQPMFVIDGHGDVSLRGRGDPPYEPKEDLRNVAGCYQLTPTTAAWRVPVDHDVLRGSGRNAPEPLAGWLGLRPGATMTVAHPLHPLSFSWKAWAPPHISSLRPLAGALGAERGDWIVLVFDRSGTVEARIVPLEGMEPLHRLAAMVGLDVRPGDERIPTLTRLAGAFGLDPHGAESLPVRLRRAVERRRDVDIAALAQEALFG